jgi:hypothetical protein
MDLWWIALTGTINSSIGTGWNHKNTKFSQDIWWPGQDSNQARAECYCFTKPITQVDIMGGSMFLQSISVESAWCDCPVNISESGECHLEQSLATPSVLSALPSTTWAWSDINIKSKRKDRKDGSYHYCLSHIIQKYTYSIYLTICSTVVENTTASTKMYKQISCLAMYQF